MLSCCLRNLSLSAVHVTKNTAFRWLISMVFVGRDVDACPERLLRERHPANHMVDGVKFRLLPESCVLNGVGT